MVVGVIAVDVRWEAVAVIIYDDDVFNDHQEDVHRLGLGTIDIGRSNTNAVGALGGCAKCLWKDAGAVFEVCSGLNQRAISFYNLKVYADGVTIGIGGARCNELLSHLARLNHERSAQWVDELKYGRRVHRTIDDRDGDRLRNAHIFTIIGDAAHFVVGCLSGGKDGYAATVV